MIFVSTQLQRGSAEFALIELLINLTKTLHKLPTFKKLSMKFKYSYNEVPIKFQ